MFTGLVEELAVVRFIQQTSEGARLRLGAKRILTDMALGDSIAINGICLTVVEKGDDAFSVDAVPETMRRTNLSELRNGDQVHVERAMAAGGRFGGHIVSGHIDGIGQIAAVEREGLARVLTIATDFSLMRYVVEKGSICVDGVSLTVMDAHGDRFRVSIIPHTEGVTRLGQASVGHVVNLEMDVVAKYIERLLQFGGDAADGQTSRSGGLSLSFLQENGYA